MTRLLTPEESRLVASLRGKDAHWVALSVKASPKVRPSVVAEQVDGWNRLAVKVPSWCEADGLCFPFPLAIQQCSSEAVARWRASLVCGDSLLDLTGGLGVDCFFMGSGLQTVTYVDADERAVSAARNNFSILGRDNTRFVCASAEDYLRDRKDAVSTIFIDPARRSSSGGRVFRIADCSPDVSRLADKMLSVADVVLIKLSPLLDVSLAVSQVPAVSDIYAIGHSGECKDLMLRLSKAACGAPELHAVNIGKGGEVSCFSFTKEEEFEAQNETGAEIYVGMYLFEPSPVIMKMAPFRLIAKRYGLRQIAPSTHIFVSSAFVANFPGRRFVVRGVFDNTKRGLAALKKQCHEASIVVRNFPVKAEELRRKLGLKESDHSFLFGVTDSESHKLLLLCERAVS